MGFTARIHLEASDHGEGSTPKTGVGNILYPSREATLFTVGPAVLGLDYTSARHSLPNILPLFVNTRNQSFSPLPVTKYFLLSPDFSPIQGKKGVRHSHQCLPSNHLARNREFQFST